MSPEATAAPEDAPGQAQTPATGESVEIPKQQSADEAADNEAGESARK
ncbi:gliding motility protein [Streptomyces sp. NPDC059828]